MLPEVIGRIYDCALDPALWPETLAEIRGSLNFAHAALTLQALPHGGVLLNVASGIEGAWLQRLADYGPEIVALWGGPANIAAAPLEEPVLLSEMNPGVVDGSGATNRFHEEWHRPQGVIDLAAVGLARDAQSLATLSFARHERHGPIGAHERDSLHRLAPHMRRAITISRLLDARAVAAATFEGVIEATHTPVLVIDGQLRVLYANGPALALLDRRDALRIAQGRLATSLPQATQSLAMAVARGAAGEADMARRGMAIPLRGADGVARALHVLPLRGGTLRAGLMSAAAAAIFVSSAGPPPAEAGELVGPLFALSAKEAQVFDLIAQGLTPGEAATEMDIAVATVRTHLLRIYDKTGTRRQADLVRLAANLSLPPG